MAYCDKCGAYIPDGQEKCLACGYDPAEEKKEQAVRAAQQAARQTEHKSESSYSYINEDLKRKLDEQRRKQQEQAKAWAEQEKQHRESQKQQSEHRQESTAYSARRFSPQKSRVLSILSYISFLFLIPMFFQPDDSSALFHAKQGLRLFVFGLICDALAWIPVAGQLIQLVRLYLMIKGIINAANGRDKPLPYIGTIGR